MDAERSENADRPAWARGDLGLLCILLALTLGLRLWQLTHTEVAARDSISFIRVAWKLENENIGDVLRTCGQHPAYPAAVALLSQLVRPLYPDDLPRAMQLTSQLVSILASLVLVVLMYGLGRELFDQRIAFWGALALQCLPPSGRLMADGLSEPLFLMFVAAAVWSAAVGVRCGSAKWLAVTGFCGALAYLTRPEGALVVGAAGVTLLVTRIVPAWRRPWRQMLAAGAALSLAFIALAAPYMWTIGNFSAKNTTKIVLQQSVTQLPPEVPPTGTQQSILMFADWDSSFRDARSRMGWAASTLARIVAGALCFVGAYFAVLGLAAGRRRFAQHPGHCVLLFTCVPLTFFLFLVAANMGYLSERHAMLFVLAGVYWAVVGVTVVSAWLAAALRQPVLASERCTVITLTLLTLLPAVRTLIPLHTDRAGFKAAGYWIAAHAPGADVEDAYCWAEFYAGCLFCSEADRRRYLDQRPEVHYVVLEHSDNEHPRLRIRSEKEILAKGGVLRASWPVKRRREQAEVRVYEVPGPMPPRSTLPLRWSRLET